MHRVSLPYVFIIHCQVYSIINIYIYIYTSNDLVHSLSKMTNSKPTIWTMYVYTSNVIITSPPIGGGRGIVMPMSVCVCVCVCVCVFVCPCFRKISKCNISAISQPIIMKLGIHITYGYTVTDKYFQNFRSKVKVVGRRKVKNVIWPYLGNEWS